jgi:hypothetical protein
MDVQQILVGKINRLPLGDHTDGLKAVRLHIEAAVRHLLRGQTDDETAFTDAIYRCNQAYEGSVKEAYRVLAAKNPEKETPANIERFLTTTNVLRQRVLAQFTNYRQEWRNPAAHDHKLDFDEDEALLAIVSVTAFAIVLCDQIDGKLAYNATKTATNPAELAVLTGSLLDQVAASISHFSKSSTAAGADFWARVRAYDNVRSSLAGFLTAEFSPNGELTVEQDSQLQGREADIVVSTSSEKIVVEVKTTRHVSGATRHMIDSGLLQADRYLELDGVTGAVLLIFSPEKADYAVFPVPGPHKHKLKIVAAKEVMA